MDIQHVLQQGYQALSKTSDSTMLDAQVILAYVLQCNTAHLMAWSEKNLNDEQISQYLQLIQQRRQGLPVAHLTGQREFWSLNFNVDNSTLIPRPETETLVEFILEKFNHKKNLKLLDMGTGTGAIAISIAKEKPEWEIFASDISEQALKLAAQNNEQHQTRNVTFIHSNWFYNITEHDFDIIVSNPPYIANNDPHLTIGDVRFEPQSALTSGDTGMDDIEHLCAQAKNQLQKNGWLIVEHGYNQAQPVADCFAKNTYTKIGQKKDLSGHIRMTAGKYK
ncbi:Peptide chain release factor N(5)-glutamine methyltransferase [hydrothermal vent metagenome]|uniref:peptide chain release factor N(5)-glutamine methyltransferase n=1 Tax=hydrothermal vent metagenome TaxID=652676 RepID=A0A3B0W2L1_9ZZZZ